MSKRQTGEPIRVVIAEDSLSQRELLVRLLQKNNAFVVIGTASNGKEAVETTRRLRPDIIAMDIHMPILDGYEATRLIMQECPTPIVMISNSIGDESLRSMDALAAGALAVLRKPGVIGSSTHEQELQALLRTLRLMADVPLVTRRAARITPSQPVTPQAPPRQAQVLAIAASTGGPAAVQVVLSNLLTETDGAAQSNNARFPLPILLVQHIARGFVDALVSWLNTTVPLTVKIARHQEPLLPGHVYLAPDEYHLRAGHGGVVVLQACKGEDRYCPSGDILFESVAQIYQNRAIGVILTGMGDDGAQGLRLLRAAGSPTLAQDEASCVVYGMPHAALLNGAVAQTLPLNAIGSAILNQLHHKNQRVVQ